MKKKLHYNAKSDPTTRVPTPNVVASFEDRGLNPSFVFLASRRFGTGFCCLTTCFLAFIGTLNDLGRPAWRWLLFGNSRLPEIGATVLTICGFLGDLPLMLVAGETDLPLGTFCDGTVLA